MQTSFIKHSMTIMKRRFDKKITHLLTNLSIAINCGPLKTPMQSKALKRGRNCTAFGKQKECVCWELTAYHFWQQTILPILCLLQFGKVVLYSVPKCRKIRFVRSFFSLLEAIRLTET